MLSKAFACAGLTGRLGPRPSRLPGELSTCACSAQERCSLARGAALPVGRCDRSWPTLHVHSCLQARGEQQQESYGQNCFIKPHFHSS